MRRKTVGLLVLALFSLLGVAALSVRSHAQKSQVSPPVIPKTWDDEAIRTLEVPLAEPSASPAHVRSDYYYRIAVRPIYKTYIVYHPEKEPPGYMDWLKQGEPEIVFDASKLKTEADWIKAGETVFDAPVAFGLRVGNTISDMRDPGWYGKYGVRVTKDGKMPFYVYVVRKKGEVELGGFGCATCHTRVMDDGTVIKGAQGNFTVDAAFAPALLRAGVEPARRLERGFFAAPWLRPDPQARAAELPLEEIIAMHAAIPAGVMTRQGTSPFYPPQIPDLIGLKDRLYFDHTGLVRHRGVGDVMRYAALNQGADDFAQYGDFRPIEVFFGRLPEPTDPRLDRYSDEQLYALALYLYSLPPPPNPNKFGAVARRGKKVFEREGCAMCHTPPLYTNNMLTPVEGFTPPEDHLKKFHILAVTLGTDPNLALTTRRGTGYYKVPSLKGVWYRSMFEHNGSCATLEDWFDPRRQRDDYVPTGFKGYGVKNRAVKGHPFGLELSPEDKKALIAFLKTL